MVCHCRLYIASKKLHRAEIVDDYSWFWLFKCDYASWATSARVGSLLSAIVVLLIIAKQKHPLRRASPSLDCFRPPFRFSLPLAFALPRSTIPPSPSCFLPHFTISHFSSRSLIIEPTKKRRSEEKKKSSYRVATGSLSRIFRGIRFKTRAAHLKRRKRRQ